MRWLMRIVGGLFCLALIGAAYQAAGTALDARRYPPPGKLVEVHGHQMHLSCTGDGSPTVVLEAAGSGWSLYWSRVQPEVARFTRVCSYDRAGLGWSESGPPPRTGQHMADELYTLLDRGGVTGPSMLVGHSLGGFIVRLYRHQYPTDVVGMVLVDAGHERQFEQDEFRKFVAPGKTAFPIIRAVTALGIPRFFAVFDVLPALLARQEEHVPAEIRPMLRAGWLKTTYYATMVEEGAALEETCTEVQHIGSLGDLPLLVLTATGPVWWPDLPPEVDSEKFRAMWLLLQQDLTRLSSNSRQVFADRSSHFVQFDQPELVVEAIRQVVKIARQQHERQQR